MPPPLSKLSFDEHHLYSSGPLLWSLRDAACEGPSACDQEWLLGLGQSNSCYVTCQAVIQLAVWQQTVFKSAECTDSERSKNTRIIQKHAFELFLFISRISSSVLITVNYVKNIRIIIREMGSGGIGTVDDMWELVGDGTWRWDLEMGFGDRIWR